MARGDIALTITLAPDIDKILTKLAQKLKLSKKEIVSQGIKLLADTAK